jgi:hypothetical protein
MLMWLTRTPLKYMEMVNGAEILSTVNRCATAALAKKKRSPRYILYSLTFSPLCTNCHSFNVSLFRGFFIVVRLYYFYCVDVEAHISLFQV